MRPQAISVRTDDSLGSASLAVSGTQRRSTGPKIVVAAPPGPAFAVVRPQSIVLSTGNDPGSSARNVWTGVVGDIDRLGDRARVGVVGAFPVTAEITAAALDDLALRPGDQVVASLKATEISIYPA